MGKHSGLETSLVGVAGEYFVAAELSIRGLLASITLRNSRGVDIIASSSDASRSVSIQVKTSSGKAPKWMLSKNSESFASDTHFYAFVLLRGVGDRPDFYVVPSRVVAKYIADSHRRWLAGVKADGSPRKDSAMRNFIDREGVYKEAWQLLNLGEQ